MDDLKKIIAENTATIQKMIVAYQETVKKTVDANQVTVEKMIADNQAALKRSNARMMDNAQLANPVMGNNQERVDQALNEAQTRLDRAVMDNRLAGGKILAEIQQISEKSLRNAQNRLDKAAEEGQKMFNKGLLEVREQTEKGIEESSNLLEQRLTGKRPGLSLRNLSPHWLSTNVLTTTSYPLGLRQSALCSLSNVYGSAMMGKIERQIEDIEKTRQKEYSSILNELEQKLADLQNEWTKKETTYLNGLAAKFGQTINQLEQDIRSQNNSLTNNLKKVDTLNPQAATECCNQTQNQILNLQSIAIQVLAKLFRELNTYDEINMTTLLQETDLLRSEAASAVEHVTAVIEHKLIDFQSKIGKA